MTDSRTAIVQSGYDEMAEQYLVWSRAIEGDPRDRFLNELARRLRDGAHVLDLGCGAGVPSTKQLSERFEVVGVDISDEQLRLARANVSAATFVRGDLSRLEFEDETFDGITAFYSISHVPREEHDAVFKKVSRWLRPGGFFLASLLPLAAPIGQASGLVCRCSSAATTPTRTVVCSKRRDWLLCSTRSSR
jgi:ubiquinone/menaquinone biosynthesis C-methylase UbiE